MIGIIIPLVEESIFLHKNLTQHQQVMIGGLTYHTGKMADKTIVYVNSGLGKTNAAIITARLINDFEPALVFLVGTAGGIIHQIERNNVVIGKYVVDADFGLLTSTGIQFPYHQYLFHPQKKLTLPIQFNLDIKLEKMLTRIIHPHPNIIFGKIATSDALPNQPAQIELLQQGMFDIIEMEGSAVMQTCWLFNTACIVVRGVSNKINEKITQHHIQLAADNATKVLIEIILNYKN